MKTDTQLIDTIRPNKLNRPWMGFELGSNEKTFQNPTGLVPILLSPSGKDWLMQRIQTGYNAGFRVFVFHRVFGETANQSIMQADSGVTTVERAENDKSYEPAANWVRNFKQFVEEFHRKFPDAELVIYVGAIAHGAMMDMLDSSQVGSWMKRVVDVFMDTLDFPFVHVGHDYLNTYPPDSAEYKILDAMRYAMKASNRHSFIEGIPTTDQDHAEHISWDGLCLETYWDTFIVPKHGSSNMPPHLNNGNLYVRWWSGHAVKHNLFNGDVRAWAKNCYETNTVPCINYSEWMDLQGIETVEELIQDMKGLFNPTVPFVENPVFDIELQTTQPQKYGNTNTGVLQQVIPISEDWNSSTKGLRVVEEAISTALQLSVRSIMLPVSNQSSSVIESVVDFIRNAVPDVIIIGQLREPVVTNFELFDYVAVSKEISSRQDFTNIRAWVDRYRADIESVRSRMKDPSKVVAMMKCHYTADDLKWLPSTYQSKPIDSLFIDNFRWSIMCRELYRTVTSVGVAYENSHRAGARMMIKLTESERFRAGIV